MIAVIAVFNVVIRAVWCRHYFLLLHNVPKRKWNLIGA